MLLPIFPLQIDPKVVQLYNWHSTSPGTHLYPNDESRSVIQNVHEKIKHDLNPETIFQIMDFRNLLSLMIIRLYLSMPLQKYLKNGFKRWIKWLRLASFTSRENKSMMQVPGLADLMQEANTMKGELASWSYPNMCYMVPKKGLCKRL